MKDNPVPFMKQLLMVIPAVISGVAAYLIEYFAASPTAIIIAGILKIIMFICLVPPVLLLMRYVIGGNS